MEKQFITSELSRDLKLNSKPIKSKIKMDDVFITQEKKVLSSVVKSKTKGGLKSYQKIDIFSKKDENKKFS